MDAVSQTFQCPEKHFTVGTGSRIWPHLAGKYGDNTRNGSCRTEKRVLLHWKLLVFSSINRLREIRAVMI